MQTIIFKEHLILSVQDNDEKKCREFLDLKFTYNIYPPCVKAQQLVELEEILLYKDAKLSIRQLVISPKDDVDALMN